MNVPVNIDRRRVLAGGGALIVSFSLSGALAQQQGAPAPAPAPSPPGRLKSSPYLDAWIGIDADPRVEIGRSFQAAGRARCRSWDGRALLLRQSA